MNGRDRIFLTGVTGTVGSFLAARALESGSRVRALMRDAEEGPARDRIGRALAVAGAGELADAVEIVRGDLCQSHLGLDGREKDLSDTSLVLHCAACTEFDDASAERNRRTNVDGAAAVLALTERLGCPLVHVSTAYVAGRRRGRVTEADLDLAGPFHNSYEQTKCLAEHLVHQWSARTRLPTIVLRPSILVGESVSGRIVHFHALYHIMRFFDAVGEGGRARRIRVEADAAATKNFVPVDYFADAAWHIIRRGQPGTYHLTHPRPITLEELREVFIALFGATGIELVGGESFRRRPGDRAERMFRSLSAYYAPYMQGEPAFDRASADAALAGAGIEMPTMDAAFYRRLADYARSVDWGRQTPPRRDAAACPSDYERYFEGFLASKTGRRLLPDLKKLTATFHVVPREAPRRHWSVRVRQGVLESVSAGGEAHDCSFLLDVATFRQIVAGRLAPQKAFFQRRVEITGDIEIGLRLTAVLAAFFQKYPFEAGDGP